jgi:hypothetical protein
MACPDRVMSNTRAYRTPSVNIGHFDDLSVTRPPRLFDLNCIDNSGQIRGFELELNAVARG